MTKLIMSIVLLIVAIITVPQINYVAHKLDTVYCEQRNEWVRDILLKFMPSGYPEGGICN